MEEEVVNEVESKKGFPAKTTVITVVAIVVVLALVIGIVNAVRPTPPVKTVKTFVKQMSNGKVGKAFKSVDYIGLSVFEDLDEDELEDFAEKYKDFKEDHEDEIDDMEEYVEEMIEEMEDEISGYEKFSIELKSVIKAKAVKGAKNLYKVKAKIKTVVQEDEDSDVERDTEDVTFYVYKDSGKYKIVGVDGDFLDF